MCIAAATLEWRSVFRLALSSSSLPSCPLGTRGDMTWVILGVCCLKCAMGKFYEI